MVGQAMSNPTVYVFACSNPEFDGYSLEEDGANLPTLASTSDCKWTLVRAVPMSRIHLQPFVRDVQVAVVNLKCRGYHIAHRTAVVLNFLRLRSTTEAT
jgi:hypothetical protein